MDLTTAIVAVICMTLIAVAVVATAWITHYQDPQLEIDHRRLRAYACHGCGHGYGSHVNHDGKPARCSSTGGLKDLSGTDCSCRYFIGRTPTFIDAEAVDIQDAPV